MTHSKGDLAIVGGGILGVILANEAIVAGFRPVVFRLSDKGVPFADSFRNQAWLQSGLRYMGKDPAVASLMRNYGRRLHEYVGLPMPTGRGVFVLRDAAAAEIFLEDAKTLGLSENEVVELERSEARRVLGSHFDEENEECRIFWSPEKPFDEGKVIRQARDQAERRGAVFCELPEPLQIIPQAGRSPSHRLLTDGQENEFAATILAAGAGNIPLLKSLRDQVDIKITQTPLLVIPGAPTIQAEILIDRVNGISLVAHAPGSSRSDGCTVLAAANVEEEIESYRLPSERDVNPDKREALLKAVPTPLRDRIGQSRTTAGWELSVVDDGKERSSTKPFIETARGYDDIIIAIPGRATLALFAAEKAMEKLKPRKTKDAAGARKALALPSAPWDGSDIRMHHEEYYDQRLND